MLSRIIIISLATLGLMFPSWAAEAGVPAGPPTSAAADANARVHKLIEQLGDHDYFARQKAQAELAKIGFEAYDALLDALNDDDPEISARAKYLLRLIHVEWTVEGDPPEVKRLLQDYDSHDADDRHRLMESLAALPAGMGALPLCRLARFEQGEQFSKWAALEVTTLQPLENDLQPELSKVILQNLGNSRRVAVTWIKAYLRLREDPAAGLSDWARLTAAEQTLLQRAHQTDPDIVSFLLRVQVNVLEKRHRIDDALAVMRRLIDLERGDSQRLVELVEWLLDQKAWALVDEVAARFPKRFVNNPGMKYLLAEGQAGRGNAHAADDIVRIARAMYPGKDERSLDIHWRIAYLLFRRGKYAWAEQEFRDVIARAPRTSEYGWRACSGLTEMLHDQAQERAAAEVWRVFFDHFGKEKADSDALSEEHSIGEYRARMYYYLACACQEEGKLDQQRANLEKGLHAFPGEIDTLIACYHLPNISAEFRGQLTELIRKAGDPYRKEIADNPTPQNREQAAKCAVPYNQLSWLIANTEGDFDEGLRFAKTAVELDPANGDFYDTLGRAYYACGDCTNAVKYQSKAAEMEPHKGLIARQLAFFKKACAGQQNKEAPKKP